MPAEAVIPADMHPALRQETAGEVRTSAIWPLALVLYMTLLPREVRIEVGTLVLSADRVALLLLAPYIVQKILSGAIRFNLADMLMALAGGWMIVAMSIHLGLGQGIERGGALAFDCLAPYFLARVCIRSFDDLRRLLAAFAPGLLIAALSIAVEGVFQYPFIQRTAENLFGPLPVYVSGNEAGFSDRASATRFGILRAQGPFPHSILAGLYLTALIGLFNLAGLKSRLRAVGNLAGLLAVFTLSSAAILALLLSWALVTFDRLQRVVRELSWSLLILGSGALAFALEMVSDSGAIGLIGRHLTFDSQTYYFRMIIWEYGMKSVWAHPLFGIGFTGYERPAWIGTESIDAYWLLLGVRFGIAVALAMLAAPVLVIVRLARKSVGAAYADQRMLRGLAISLFVMALSLFSVAIWGCLQVFYSVLLGCCASCAWLDRSAEAAPE